ncbi:MULTISPECIES: xanthine dehydrogenase family protein subunit M [unclassified Leeuwenhoekiella]|uniref:FAD binding domain-containing protein n=1 Tax=unclassified Leeuwenhoekiella TaxID=2615029 RepID=UPI000C4A3B9A|nr:MULTISPECIES: xanthine dehydrogenase family protein subunit M [unclassified Leeuwenhoekiella]MAW94489.1 FAD-binding molybdopterin dehydrogenase [Leeuwenhoekiella sp.]MAW96985.1 FAD-binding molybdopterin dehydrogenase [Leeuwenhoekiella sp.]MBA81167.1 FAD-binding molybdopterin dehydrogenase [Leeuwenhoekiella sp.]|tara:strand:- start:2718 stop:3695 length:978 start_codon:yes stop_codon:yes gene_type:complete
MKPFEYTRLSKDDLATGTIPIDSTFLAGGTNLVDLMKYGVEEPNSIADVGELPYNQIEESASGLMLGALVTNADTAYHPTVKNKYPLLNKAILSAASAQLRNRATNGGNLLQRTRCYYFYDTAMPCNKREPGSGCAAVNGFNRIHAILGTSASCIATHPSDMCVALAALEAKVHVLRKGDSLVIPFDQLHRLPGNQPEKDHNLLPGDLITHIELPEEGFSGNFEYLKIRDRESYAFALVSVAACLKLSEGRIEDIRVALGGVAHKPWKLKEVEQEYIGKAASPELFQSLAEKLTRGAQGFGTNDFKIPLVKRAIVRALTNALNPA